MPCTNKTSNTDINDVRIPLDLSSFKQYSAHANSQNNQEQFGQRVRLAMECIEAPPILVKGNAIPSDEASIRTRLKTLSQEISSQHADLLELLVKFDDLQGWKSSGASHCAAWMNLELGISLQLSWEYLRVGRKLPLLPILRSLFRAGKLSWSKVRLISRVADQDNEAVLCHAALDASVSELKQICQGYQWNKDQDDATTQNDRALQQWDTRSLTWNDTSNGSTRIQLVLPPELAQAFLNSVEQSLNQIKANDAKMAQRRADAAVLMAETSLQSAGRDTAIADRYQVIVSVDAKDLSTAHADCNLKKRPTLSGAGPIATETAKRISCDCSLSVIKKANGEPIDIGRKSRIWPNALERAIKDRDQQCVWPGCTQSRHLHIHHIKHWADGGTTSIENGVCLCSRHHTLVHEGGYSIQRVDGNEQRKNEQFEQQKHAEDISQFEFERALRYSEASFNAVRKLSPTRYRFRVVDAHGTDILNAADAKMASQSHSVLVNAPNKPVLWIHESHITPTSHHSHENIHVEHENAMTINS